MRPTDRRRVVRRASVPAAALLVLSLSGSVLAQAPPVLGPTPTPRPSSTPTPAPSSEPAPTATPQPSDDPLVPPLGPSPSAPAEPAPTPTPPADGSPSPSPEVTPTPGPFEIPPGFEMPQVERTAARNTSDLVEILRGVTEVGIPLEDALLEGMGRFPVAGLAFYSDDWMNPRFVPYFHLHEGVDIFAEAGTPLKAPDSGVVTRLVDGPIGGIALWMRGSDGTQYYFAHMQEWASGIEEGRTVELGEVLGSVGDSGNAKGGLPHLHFEIHAPDVVRPKPIVDGWLDEALEAAPAWVEARMQDVVQTRQLMRTEQSLAGVLSADRSEPGATPEYTFLLSLLDPVGGSVGVLPRLPLVPGREERPPEQLMREIIRLRVGGGILLQDSLGSPFRDAGAARFGDAP